MWELSVQFGYESKTAPKSKIYSLKKKDFQTRIPQGFSCSAPGGLEKNGGMGGGGGKSQESLQTNL